MVLIKLVMEMKIGRQVNCMNEELLVLYIRHHLCLPYVDTA